MGLALCLVAGRKLRELEWRVRWIIHAEAVALPSATEKVSYFS